MLCSKCGYWIASNVTHACIGSTPATVFAGFTGFTGFNIGVRFPWICPKCNCGVAPHVDRCPCGLASK